MRQVEHVETVQHWALSGKLMRLPLSSCLWCNSHARCLHLFTISIMTVGHSSKRFSRSCSDFHLYMSPLSSHCPLHPFPSMLLLFLFCAVSFRLVVWKKTDGRTLQRWRWVGGDNTSSHMWAVRQNSSSRVVSSDDPQTPAGIYNWTRMEPVASFNVQGLFYYTVWTMGLIRGYLLGHYNNIVTSKCLEWVDLWPQQHVAQFNCLCCCISEIISCLFHIYDFQRFLTGHKSVMYCFSWRSDIDGPEYNNICLIWSWKLQDF